MPKKQGLTLVAYPESLPSDWQTQLDMLPFGYCFALHDKDIDEQGNKKKAHIHIFFQANPTAKQKKYISQVTGINFLIDVHSARDMYDYMTHENQSNKYHYSKDIITCSDNWSQEAFDAIASNEPKKIELGDLVIMIKENRLCDIMQLTDFVISNFDDSNLYLDAIRRNGYVLKEYLYQFKCTLSRPVQIKNGEPKTAFDAIDDLNGLKRGSWVGGGIE